MTVQPNSIEARDIAYHLHSYTNARKHEEIGPIVIESGKGVHVTDTDGKTYIEAMAGLWSVAVGFGEKRLAEAAARQMEKLAFYHTFTHKSHGPAIELAEKLVAMAPVPMSKAYFTNSGSEANDTMIKLVRYRANALGQPQKKKIISRIKGYHGVTWASASLTGLPNNHRAFDLPMEGILHTSCPHYWREGRDGESEEDFATRCAQDLDALIQAEGPETIAAFIGEPVMGAGGVIVPPKTYWEKIQAVLKKYDILLVADEVICGFGRTGNMFGCETFGIQPDIMTVSKALSSSYLPISALLINETVYAPVADQSSEIGTFGHGVTAAGHPVAAAVALENLKIIEEKDLLGNVRALAPHFQESLRTLEDHPLVGEVRGVGLIAAIELVTDKPQKLSLQPPGTMGAKAFGLVQKNGVILRAIGDALAVCPPLIVEKEHIDTIVETTRRSLDELQAELG
ncbi:aspartate aminotransferase family protein [Jiella sp. M17.18]|uniref:aspartate aminotransferase family protein n=1 Tax=Jiella sp. M17.18 TaxID=3234247 RepID=UPI0034DFB023